VDVKTGNSEVPLGSKCLVCEHGQSRVLGIRGNREYSGADPHAEPHLCTNVVQCTNCEFIYLLPRISETVVLEKEHYGDPEQYEAVIDGDSSNMFGTRLSLIEKFKKTGSLLDVGAGKGEFLLQASDRGWDINGVEPSSHFCRYAKEQFNIHLFNGPLSKFKSNSDHVYDVITLNHVLEHVDHPLSLLNLVKKSLNESGILFIEVPNTTSHLLKLVDLYFKMKGLNWSSRLSPMHPPFHEFGYNNRSLRHLMQRAGYTILESQTFSGRDRGYSSKEKPEGWTTMLRNASARFLDLFGNRELLTVVARKTNQ